ncbi:mechanosensitive ion channel [Thalassobaculum sp. OXR-137]|uniref:mechanosensitive ion channel domain-containing protein n=1 Tax=Thalassobaculum sp. OXR-137 TaxID=3100173 RepID=UPI002AC9660B|nr:mechanosensitive ion channel domain-containing protein [Thalassobaculum sp. OXR-137]WPZ35286.1 mechanosensitive ion channel [Thalassobaculum sp. OXR-137]
MRLLIACLALAASLLAAPPVSAQMPGLATGSGSSGSQEATTPEEKAPETAADLRQLIQTLEDPERRAQLLSDLRTLLEAQRSGTDNAAGTARRPGEGAKETEDDGHSFSNQLSDAVVNQGERVQLVFSEVWDAVIAIRDLPEWLDDQINVEYRRKFWIEIATVGLGFPILVALIARWLTGLALGGTIQRLRNAEVPTIQAKVFTALFRTVLEAFTVAAVLGAGWAALVVVPRSYQAEQIALVVIQAIAVHTGIGVLARLILAPFAPHLRIFRVGDEMAAYLYLWVMRLTAVGVIGYVISQTALPLGAGYVGSHALEVAAAAVMTGMLLILVTQLRPTVREVIRGGGKSVVRRRFADIWNLLASLYILVGFGIFVSGAQDGFLFMLRATVITIVTVAIALTAQHIANKLLDRLFAVDEELEKRFPGLRKRANLYRPTLKKAVDIVIFIVAAVAILEGWNAGVISALDAQTQTAVLRSAGTIILVLIVCIVIWELTASGIARALSGTNSDGSPREASSRTKTLLPLLRRAVLVALVVFGGLIVLSELGIDIAPLLAGAGVVGLAIGFGSQALVRDVITGLFILIEDTVAVGDVITAGGHTGVVEDMSIRTIRLRDLEGSVHIIPFGDVTSVINLTKDFSYALLDVGVAYREDTDRVSEVIKEVADEMQADEAWKALFLDPIEILGVNELADSAVIIRCRIKTPPIKQWGVKREMLRRLKKRFDAENIEIPFPHTTVYFGVDAAGKAPPAHITLQAEEAARQIAPPPDATVEEVTPPKQPATDPPPESDDGVGRT